MATKAKKAVKGKVTKPTKKIQPSKAVKKVVAKKSLAGVAKGGKAVVDKKKPAIKTKPAVKKAAPKKVVSKSNIKAKAKPSKVVESKTKKVATPLKNPVVAKPVAKKVAAKAKPVVSKKIAQKAVAKPQVVKKAAKPTVQPIKVKLPVFSKGKSTVAKPIRTRAIFLREPQPHIDVHAEILPYQEEPDEDYMNDKQRLHFRHILLQRKHQIMEEMGRTVHHLQDEAANFPDPNDRATQEEEFSLELRTRDRERKFIKNIEDALQKLDEGEYGYCTACGIEIGIRRLEARPTADLCIDCKTLDEIRERQMGG